MKTMKTVYKEQNLVTKNDIRLQTNEISLYRMKSS